MFYFPASQLAVLINSEGGEGPKIVLNLHGRQFQYRDLNKEENFL